MSHKRIPLSEFWEYQYCESRGHVPLLSYTFDLDIDLRVQIQRDLFFTGAERNVERANEKYYRWVWKHKKHVCEECLKPLGDYSSVYISHILTKGSYPEMAHDPRNNNILCFDHHNLWENGNRESMRVYRHNMGVIGLLNSEYSKINKKKNRK